MSRSKRFTRNLGRKLGVPKPVRTTVEWVRFEHAYAPYGLFSYLSKALPKLPKGKRENAEAIERWFNDHLGSPSKATLERFWFRAEAVEHIEKARVLARIVSSTGIQIVERRIKRVPGKVKWEDSHQAAVFTYRDAPQPKRRAPGR